MPETIPLTNHKRVSFTSFIPLLGLLGVYLIIDIWWMGHWVCHIIFSRIINGSLKELPCYGYLWLPRMKQWRNELNDLNWLELNWIDLNEWILKRKSRTKASFSDLQLSLFWELADARHAVFCIKNVPRKMDGGFCPADSCGSCSDRLRIGTASSGLQLEPSKFEGRLAR